jgi:xanthine dehydrogenase YagT iron-sulfur-binding subunit
MQQQNRDDGPFDSSRRTFLKQSTALAALSITPSVLTTAAKHEEQITAFFDKVRITLEVNGTSHDLQIEPRVTLLDLLREQLKLTGTKKGCDYGQCGACTVHIDGERRLACLSLAVMQANKKITTIEGLAKDGELHPLQQAFIHHDGFQCGYCTPGQIMSGIGCIREGHAGSTAEIQEFMSGNICRCGAYPNITAAIEEVQKKGGAV